MSDKDQPGYYDPEPRDECGHCGVGEGDDFHGLPRGFCACDLIDGKLPPADILERATRETTADGARAIIHSGANPQVLARIRRARTIHDLEEKHAEAMAMIDHFEDLDMADVALGYHDLAAALSARIRELRS